MAIDDMSTKRLNEAMSVLDTLLVFQMTKGDCSLRGEPTRLPSGEIEFFDSILARQHREPTRKLLGLHGVKGVFRSGHYVFRITDEVFSWIRAVEEAVHPGKIEALQAAQQTARRKISLPKRAVRR